MATATTYTLDRFLSDTRATIKTKGIPAGLERGWLTEMARCPVGGRRSRRKPWTGSNPVPSA